MISQLFSKIKVTRQLRQKAEAGNKATDKVWLYNYWETPVEKTWLTRFLRAHGFLDNDKRFSFYSVNGDKRVIRYDKREVKIFITGENVHLPQFYSYKDNMLSEDKIDLAIGFDEIENEERYIRFPLWIRTSFLPEWTETEILNHIQRLRYPYIGERNRFAALVARYDWGNTRSEIYESLKQVNHIHCPSRVLHNDDTLKKDYQDDKQAYLHQFCFNICPENSNYNGYVTEKVFDSISAGCIPIYWGSDNQPEPNVLNQGAIMLWNIDGDNSHNISLIKQLWENKSELDDFMHQPRLKDSAEDVIMDYFSNLEKSIKSLL